MSAPDPGLFLVPTALTGASKAFGRDSTPRLSRATARQTAADIVVGQRNRPADPDGTLVIRETSA
jgi:hypothetical protein